MYPSFTCYYMYIATGIMHSCSTAIESTSYTGYSKEKLCKNYKAAKISEPT